MQKSRFATTRSFFSEQWMGRTSGAAACNFSLPIIRLIPTGASCAAVPKPIAVEPQVFDLLVYLVQNRDRVVSKDDLIASVWGGRIVSDSTLTSRINAARKAVGDSGEDQKLIRTIARKGLRFVGDVQHRRDQAAAAADPPRSARRSARAVAHRPCRCPTGPPSPCFRSPT